MLYLEILTAIPSLELHYKAWQLGLKFQEKTGSFLGPQPWSSCKTLWWGFQPRLLTPPSFLDCEIETTWIPPCVALK